MSPKVKRYTDIYVTLTYTGTETHVSFGLFIPEIHFFGQGLKFLLPPKGLKHVHIIVTCFAIAMNQYHPLISLSITKGKSLQCKNKPEQKF